MQAQTNEKNAYTYRLSFLSGKLLENYEGLPSYGKSNYFEFDIHRQANNYEIWKQSYFFPEIGASVLYGNLGNDSILGSVFSIYPSWYFNIYRTNRLGVLLKMGVGFSYFNKPFNLIDNPSNIFVGSHITNITSLGASVRIKIIEPIHLTAGFSLIHFSNGHVKLPNVGINDRRFHIGLQYTPHQKKYQRVKPCDYKKSPFLINVRTSIGLHEAGGTTRPIGGKKFAIYGISAYVSKQRNCNNYYVGLNAMYYSSYYNFIRLEDIHIGHERKNSMVMGSFLGHEFLFKRVSFAQEFIQKFYNPLYEDMKLYSPTDSESKIWLKKAFSFRLGFKYYWLGDAKEQKHNVSTGIFIKSNLAQADFVEFNINYSL